MQRIISVLGIALSLSVLLSVFGLPGASALDLTQEQANKVNKLLAEGNAAMMKNDFPAAVTKYRGALEIVPSYKELYVNLGMAVGMQGQYEEGIKLVKEGIEASPNEPKAVLDLGALYQSSGQLPMAVATFEDFLKRFPNDPRVPRFKALVASIKETLKTSTDSADAADYFQKAEDFGKWDLSKLPLKVFVAEGSTAEGYKPLFKPAVESAFQDWQEKSDGLFKFVFVDGPDDSDISVRWTDNPKQLVMAAEAGDCQRTFKDESTLKHVMITMLTTHKKDKEMSFNDVYVRWIAMHEIGHALGIIAHSSNARDIMYSSLTFDVDKKDISARDIATLKRVYASDGH